MSHHTWVVWNSCSCVIMLYPSPLEANGHSFWCTVMFKNISLLVWLKDSILSYYTGWERVCHFLNSCCIRLCCLSCNYFFYHFLRNNKGGRSYELWKSLLRTLWMLIFVHVKVQLFTSWKRFSFSWGDPVSLDLGQDRPSLWNEPPTTWRTVYYSRHEETHEAPPTPAISKWPEDSLF